MKFLPAGSIRSSLRVAAPLLWAALLSAGCATSWLDQANRDVSAAERSGDPLSIGRALSKRGEAWALRAVHPDNGAASTASMAAWAERDFIASFASFARSSEPAAGAAALRRCVELLLPGGFGAACDQQLLEPGAAGDSSGPDPVARNQFAERQARRQANRAAFERQIADAEVRQKAEREAEAARREARDRMTTAILSGIVAGAQQSQAVTPTRTPAPAPRAAYSPTPSGNPTVITPYVPNISVASRTDGSSSSSGTASSSGQGSGTAPRYRSQPANQCLAVVTAQQGSCTGPLCLRNSCSTGVYAIWGINGGNMMYGSRIMPGRAYPANPVGTRRDTISWNACSLDPAAGEYRNPSPRRGCVYVY